MTRKPLVGRFHLFLLALLVAITATAFYKIPAQTGLPVHWGFDGKPDRMWPRDQALLIFPLLGVVLVGLFAAIGRFAAVERIEPGRHISEAMLTGILGLFCALQFALILIGIGSEIDMVRIIAFALAALFVILGNVRPKSQPNAYAGIRLPWTVNDPRRWAIAHRVTGILFIIGGIGLGLVAWLLPDPQDMLLAMFAAILVPIIVGGAVSLLPQGATPSR